MIPRSRMRSLVIRCLGLACLSVSLPTAPAIAAPSLDLELKRDAVAIAHSDERLDYTVKVSNTAVPVASVGAGEVLVCAGSEPTKNWLPDAIVGPEPTFAFEWRRNGAIIPGAQAISYSATAADEGKAIQCLVTGTNPNGAAKYASLPVMVVDSQPATAPPGPSLAGAKEAGSRPTVSGTELAKRTCTPPANWTGSLSYGFRWLRNGQPIATAEAETSEYQPVEKDENTQLQCEVIGTNAGGSTVGISERSVVKPSVPAPQLPRLIPSETPELITNALAGPVTVELELPGGMGTEAFKVVDPTSVEEKGPPVGWVCDRVPPTVLEHAKAICSRTDPLGPGASYPSFTVVTALGADAPDLAVARATVFGGGAPEAASATDEFVFAPFNPFGIEAFETKVADDVGGDYTQAGGHPFSAGASFSFTTKRNLNPQNNKDANVLVEHFREVLTETPRGFIGNAQALPALCPTVEGVVAPVTCPPESMVGGLDAFVVRTGIVADIPIYAIEPEFGVAAQFAFEVTGFKTTYTFAPRLRADDGYAITIAAASVSQTPEVLSVDATLCGFGAKKNAGGAFAGCKKASDFNANPLPLITNPTRCGAPAPLVRLSVDSWEHPSKFVSKEFSTPEITGCEAVEFEPVMDLQPTSSQADSPTGMAVELSMPTDGLEDPDGISQANLKSATVTLPEGMGVNASAGHGLGACTLAQVKLGTNDPISCPDSSKIGTVEIETPLIADTLEGNVYVAKQGDNPFGSLLALYLVFDSPENGILIKVAGKVTPDPETGQLVVSFDDSPEAPFSTVRMNFPQGPRSPLLNPPKCGTYEIVSELTPWNAKDPDNPTADETVTESSFFDVTSGPGGGPCPTGALEAKLSGGTESPVAGATSPFVLRLTREDGSQRFSALEVTTPPGLTAYLKGIPYCPDAALAGISSTEGTGQAEIDNPSCPAASQVGTASAGAGAGANPFYVDTGKAYLAGPYKGAPLSLALVTPAVAGPLDLGNVVVRTALYVNPETAQITAVSDPIPTILHGIEPDIRDVRVAIDRPGFTLNPTSCEELAIKAQVKGEDGGSAGVSNRFQVGGCENLEFKPKLSVRLFGGTKRGAHPSLRGVLTAAPGEANIGRAAVTIPRSEFLDQAHIRTICTRVQFAANACPPGSIYGSAKAFTPLLDYPVEGPVYLRSSSNKLPDLVVDLHGPAHQPVRATVVGRIDSIKGQIRTTFESAPDVPISQFILSMQGGNKGLLVNSRDICTKRYRATVKLEGHNGKTHNARPAVVNSRCTKQRKTKRAHRRHQQRIG